MTLFVSSGSNFSPFSFDFKYKKMQKKYCLFFFFTAVYLLCLACMCFFFLLIHSSSKSATASHADLHQGVQRNHKCCEMEPLSRGIYLLTFYTVLQFLAVEGYAVHFTPMVCFFKRSTTLNSYTSTQIHKATKPLQLKIKTSDGAKKKNS